MQRRAMAAGGGGGCIGRGPEGDAVRAGAFLLGVPLRAATFKRSRLSPPHGIISPLNSSSFNFGRLTMPRRLSTVPLVKDQMIFSSLGADPLANSILVIDEPSTIRRLSLGNSSLLNKISFSTQAFSFSTRQRIYCILANIFRSSLLSLVPQRVTLETFSALSNNESLLLLFNSTPIDVEALEDEVQVVSASQVPPQRRNRRTRRQPVTVVDLDVHATRQGVSHDDNATVLSHNTRNKRPRVSPVINISPETGEGSSLQSKNAGKTSKEPLNVAPKEPIFTCPVCWNKLDEPATTMCGHIFCTNCIKQAIQFQKKCPTCRKHLKMNNFHRIYLPNTSR